MNYSTCADFTGILEHLHYEQSNLLALTTDHGPSGLQIIHKLAHPKINYSQLISRQLVLKIHEHPNFMSVNLSFIDDS